MFSHIFDGLAKIHSYRITQSDSDDPTSVEYQARFLEGMWYKSYKENKNSLPFGLGTGPLLDMNTKEVKTGPLRMAQALWNTFVKFDNTPVNIWDFQPNRKETNKPVAALTDAPPRTQIDLSNMDTLSSSTMNKFAKGAKGYELLITTHPQYSQGEPSAPDVVDSFNVAVAIGLDGPVINLIQESAHLDGRSERKVVTSIPSEDGVPLFHSFGISKNYVVIVAQPLRVDQLNIANMVELGFLRGMEHVDHTRIIVVDLNSGDIVLDQSVDEKVYFYHSISQAELVSDDKGTIVSLRLCAYKEPDQITGEHQFMRLEQAYKGLEWRSKIHKGGKFCDIHCDLKRQKVSVEWNEEIQQGFELPVTRYSRSYHGNDMCPDTASSSNEQPHPRYVYSFGPYALGSPDYDNWGLFKFDLEQNKIAAYFQQESVYISEPAFVANPEGTEEDDGVLLTHAYFGEEQETKFLVFDAKTMDILATAPTGFRSPMDFHGAWIPSQS